MCDSLFTFESLLVSDVDNVTASDVGHQELFSSEGFLSLLFFNKGSDVLSGCHLSAHGWDDEREHKVWIFPFWLTWFS